VPTGLGQLEQTDFAKGIMGSRTGGVGGLGQEEQVN
jgi:hypothetical protein